MVREGWVWEVHSSREDGMRILTRHADPHTAIKGIAGKGKRRLMIGS